MGIFGRNCTSKSVSKVGGGERVTLRYDDRTSEDKTYVNGRLVDITHHESDGKSHSHEVGHGLLGPFTGQRKD